MGGSDLGANPSLPCDQCYEMAVGGCSSGKSDRQLPGPSAVSAVPVSAGNMSFVLLALWRRQQRTRFTDEFEFVGNAVNELTADTVGAVSEKQQGNEAQHETSPWLLAFERWISAIVPLAADVHAMSATGRTG